MFFNADKEKRAKKINGGGRFRKISTTVPLSFM
jgi:hypothetical protein